MDTICYFIYIYGLMLNIICHQNSLLTHIYMYSFYNLFILLYPYYPIIYLLLGNPHYFIHNDIYYIIYIHSNITHSIILHIYLILFYHNILIPNIYIYLTLLFHLYSITITTITNTHLL